ncbi:MAG: sugar transferase [Firmicutes bacterium]|nr:sugar transferase [Bacillota bacterium]
MKPYITFKTILDFIFALGMTLALSPLLLILALLIKLTSPGPVFFKQRRIGKDKKEFEIYKFRTMRTDTPKDMPTHLFTDAESYITSVGKFLRKSSLDELPQLLNILKGEMSFIGPRPALWNQFDLIEARDNVNANSLRPGITGWAQINGRDEIPIDLKASYDGYYVENISFGLDFKILLGTFTTVLTAKGVSEGGPKNKED